MKRGNKYRCSVCGSETIVIRPGKGEFRPVCCNKPMLLLKRRVEMYRCPVCGSEVVVLRSKSESLQLVCCNVPMRDLAA